MRGAGSGPRLMKPARIPPAVSPIHRARAGASGGSARRRGTSARPAGPLPAASAPRAAPRPERPSGRPPACPHPTARAARSVSVRPRRLPGPGHLGGGLGDTWGRRRAARTQQGSGAGSPASGGEGDDRRARDVRPGPVPMLLSPPRSPFCFPEGAAWCMMQHRPSRRGRPGARRCPPRAPVRGPGVPGGRRRSAGSGPAGEAAEPAGDEGDLALHGAPWSTPPRHEVGGCVISRGGVPARLLAGWSRGRWPAWGRRRAPLTGGRGVRLHPPLT